MDMVTAGPRPGAASRSGKTSSGNQPPWPTISCEFFPPKPSQSIDAFWQAARDLAALSPTFCSVTYSAGGSTQRETAAIAAEMQQRFDVPAAAHLTCVDGTRDEIDRVAEGYWQAGIRHVVALRGDPKAGMGAHYQPADGGYAYADALVAGLSRLHPFEISVAAYPETHPQARSADDDLDHLKRKIDAGATRAITQFFFDVTAFERFLERCARAGITVPIVPGILPIGHFGRVAAIAEACGANIPNDLRAACNGIDDDATRRHRFAVDQAVALCSALQSLGVGAFHFYTLNRAELVRDICDGLGLMAAETPFAWRE